MALGLVCGIPGAGKTAYTIQHLLDEFTKRQGRRVIYYNLELLDKDYFPGWVEGDNDDLTKPCQDVYATGDVIIIDECQKFFPTRMPGKPVPPFLASLETHRHHGIDLFFITQAPTFSDVHIRHLCQSYSHIERPYGMPYSKRFHYDGYKDHSDKFQRSAAIVERVKVPAILFTKYKSTVLNTHKARRLPLKIFMLPVVFALALYFVYSAFMTITGKGSGFTNSISDLPLTAADAPPSGSAAMPVSSLPPVAAAAPQVKNYDSTKHGAYRTVDSRDYYTFSRDGYQYRLECLEGFTALGAKVNMFFRVGIYSDIQVTSNANYRPPIEGKTVSLSLAEAKGLGFGIQLLQNHSFYVGEDFYPSASMFRCMRQLSAPAQQQTAQQQYAISDQAKNVRSSQR